MDQDKAGSSNSGSFNPLDENRLPEGQGPELSSLGGLLLEDDEQEAQRTYLERLKTTPQLICLSGPAEGHKFWVSKPQMNLGQGFNCHVVLVDPAVAPLHARIARLPGGNYQLAATDPEEAPLLVRVRGRFRPAPSLHLRDGMVFRLGKLGPRMRYRFLGDPEQTNVLTRLLMALRYDDPLLPESVLRERLGELWRTSHLKPVERHTVLQALRYLRPLRFYRRWFYMWGLIAVALTLVGISRQLLLVDARGELSTLRQQLGSLWQSQNPYSTLPGGSQGFRRDRATQVLEGGQAGPLTAGAGQAGAGLAGTGTGMSAESAASTSGDGTGGPQTAAELSHSDEQALLSSDPLAQQVLRLLRTAGAENPQLSLAMVHQIHSELDKEVQRVKHRFELDAFVARSQKYQPRIEDIFRREFQLPTMLASLAWLESDFRLDAEDGAGRLGMWQLTEDVATEYGLITDQGEDFRMDFEASTRGAARYLADLVTRYGLEQLPLVVAAFHLGPDTIENTLRKHQLWRQEQRTFPYLLRLSGTGDADTLTAEQLQYVSRFLAVQIISSNQSYYLNASQP